MTERLPLHGPPSAYAALGLEPGADRAQVEQAYRRLIKLYHPDRSGGDAARAAEINRAYFELCRGQDVDSPAAVAETLHRAAAPRRSSRTRAGPPPVRRRRARVWPLVPLALAAWMLIEREWVVEQAPPWIASLGESGPPVHAAGGAGSIRLDSEAIDGPLVELVIAEAADEAVRLASRGGEEALASHSRECHRRLRLQPELAQLDRCAAFDDAVAMITDRMGLSDRRTFNASAITARQMTAASLLSTDYLANERRLDRIRTRVELILLPRPEPLPPVAIADEQPPAGADELESVPVEP